MLDLKIPVLEICRPQNQYKKKYLLQRKVQEALLYICRLCLSQLMKAELSRFCSGTVGSFGTTETWRSPGCGGDPFIFLASMTEFIKNESH